MTQVPTAPLNRLIDSYMKEKDVTRHELSRTVARGIGFTEAYVLLSDVENESAVSFDQADHLLSRLGLTTMWFVDPELRDIYATVEL